MPEAKLNVTNFSPTRLFKKFSLEFKRLSKKYFRSVTPVRNQDLRRKILEEILKFNCAASVGSDGGCITVPSLPHASHYTLSAGSAVQSTAAAAGTTGRDDHHDTTDHVHGEGEGDPDHGRHRSPRTREQCRDSKDQSERALGLTIPSDGLLPSHSYKDYLLLFPLRHTIANRLTHDDTDNHYATCPGDEFWWAYKICFIKG